MSGEYEDDGPNSPSGGVDPADFDPHHGDEAAAEEERRAEEERMAELEAAEQSIAAPKPKVEKKRVTGADRTSTPIMTRFEYARLIRARAEMNAHGSLSDPRIECKTDS